MGGGRDDLAPISYRCLAGWSFKNVELEKSAAVFLKEEVRAESGAILVASKYDT